MLSQIFSFFLDSPIFDGRKVPGVGLLESAFYRAWPFSRMATLQCSCLENPRDGGAWWAAVYGGAHSRTQLKRLSSSSSSLYLGKGSSISLQYSCLENPLDRGAWWAAVHGVAHSRTQLKRLSIACCPPLPGKQFFLHDPADISGTWWNRSHSMAGWVACV